MPTGRAPSASPPVAASWTFLTNHAHVLLCLSAAPESRMRDVAGQVGITERAVQHIVRDLVEAEVLVRLREGRRNRYTIHPDVPLRHPIEAHRSVADLLALGALPAGRRPTAVPTAATRAVVERAQTPERGPRSRGRRPLTISPTARRSASPP